MTSLPNLHVTLFERTDDPRFNNTKIDRLLSKGEVAFSACLEELLLIIATPPPRKPKIVKFEKDVVMISHDRIRLLGNMQMMDTATPDHTDFGYEFRVGEHWEMWGFELFVQNLCALSNLFKLTPYAPLSGRIEAITEECRARAFAK